MSRRSKIILCSILWLLVGCGGDTGRWAGKGAEREARKFGITKKMAKFYVYFEKSNLKNYCPVPAMLSEGSLELLQTDQPTTISHNFDKRYMTRDFTLTLINTDFCPFEYFVVTLKPGVAYIKIADQMVALDAKAETNYYLRLTVTTGSYFYGDQIFQSKDVTSQLETVSEEEAIKEINANYHLLNINITSYKKTR